LAQQRHRRVVGRRFTPPRKGGGDKVGRGNASAGEVVLYCDSVVPNVAGRRRVQEPDREEHDLRNPPVPAGQQYRGRSELGYGIVTPRAARGPASETLSQVRVPAEIAERELGARHEELGLYRAGDAGAHVSPGE
jgi:hypothetical protein